MDKIALFNEVVKLAKPAARKHAVATSLDQDVAKDLDLDSLDTLMITVFLSDVYGVPEEKLKQLAPKQIKMPNGTMSKSLTLTDIYAFMDQHKTTEPGSLEEALEKIK